MNRPLTLKDLLKNPYRRKARQGPRDLPDWERILEEMIERYSTRLIREDMVGEMETLRHDLMMLASEETNSERINRLMSLFEQLLWEVS